MNIMDDTIYFCEEIKIEKNDIDYEIILQPSVTEYRISQVNIDGTGYKYVSKENIHPTAINVILDKIYIIDNMGEIYVYDAEYKLVSAYRVSDRTHRRQTSANCLQNVDFFRCIW